MDIKILNIKYNLGIADVTWGNETKREFRMKGYTVEYYLGKYIRSIIDIATDKELTVDEIKQKIKETYRSMVTKSE